MHCNVTCCCVERTAHGSQQGTVRNIVVQCSVQKWGIPHVTIHCNFIFQDKALVFHKFLGKVIHATLHIVNAMQHSVAQNARLGKFTVCLVLC